MNSLRRLLPYLRRHRRVYALGLVVVLFATAAGAVAPPLVGYAIDRLRTGADKNFILTVAAAVAGAALVRAGLLFVSRYHSVLNGLDSLLFGTLRTSPSTWSASTSPRSPSPSTS